MFPSSLQGPRCSPAPPRVSQFWQKRNELILKENLLFFTPLILFFQTQCFSLKEDACEWLRRLMTWPRVFITCHKLMYLLLDTQWSHSALIFECLGLFLRLFSCFSDRGVIAVTEGIISDEFITPLASPGRLHSPEFVPGPWGYRGGSLGEHTPQQVSPEAQVCVQ